MIYNELKALRKEITIVENAVIPVVKLSPKELQDHKKDLEEALKGERFDTKELKKG